MISLLNDVVNAFAPWSEFLNKSCPILLFENWYKKNQRFYAGISSSCAVFTFNTCEIIEDTTPSSDFSCTMARIVVNGKHI
jgi:hypothetical protein